MRRFGIELEAGDDDRHAQGMRPDTLAAPQVLVAVGFPGVFDGRLETLGIDRGQAFGEGDEELLEVAQGGDGMDDGYHGADYKADHRHAMRAKSTHRRPMAAQRASPAAGLTL